MKNLWNLGVMVGGQTESSVWIMLLFFWAILVIAAHTHFACPNPAEKMHMCEVDETVSFCIVGLMFTGFFGALLLNSLYVKGEIAQFGYLALPLSLLMESFLMLLIIRLRWSAKDNLSES